MGILDKLRSMGIGVKSDYQRQREANPGMRQFGSRGGPNYADIRQQEGINREAGVNLKRYEGRLKSGEKVRNINGISYVVPAGGQVTRGMFSNPPAAQSYSNDFQSAGGQVTRGMFSNPPTAQSYSNDFQSAGGVPDFSMYDGSVDYTVPNTADIFKYAGMDFPYKGQGDPVLSFDETLAIVPEALTSWRENQLRVEENIRREEEAGRPVNLGLLNAKQRYLYDTNLEKARVERDKLLEGNISLDRQENEERRLLSQAETGKARRELFDYGGNDMASREQLQIELDPSIITVGEKPTDKEIIMALEEEYTDLAAAGADTATLSELAREIDSYRDKEVSLPSIFSEAFGADNVVDTSTAGVTGNIWADTPPATFSNVPEFTGQEAIDQVEATYGPLNELQKFLVEKEGYRPGWYEDTVGVATAGVGQTGEYAAMTPIEAMNAKINETKAKITVFDDLDLDEQKAVIDANYRGDVYDGWKDKYIAYINERTSDPKSDTLPSLKQEAYEELWNHNKYVLMMGRLQANKSVDGDNGVMKRVKKWMKTLFKDDQPTADAQAKIDAHAATLTNVVNTSTATLIDPNMRGGFQGTGEF